eukprot:scaffold306_cov525-Prasinococcus_capsulatus_cf.AAC.41
MAPGLGNGGVAHRVSRSRRAQGTRVIGRTWRCISTVGAGPKLDSVTACFSLVSCATQQVRTCFAARRGCVRGAVVLRRPRDDILEATTAALLVVADDEDATVNILAIASTVRKWLCRRGPSLASAHLARDAVTPAVLFDKQEVLAVTTAAVTLKDDRGEEQLSRTPLATPYLVAASRPGRAPVRCATRPVRSSNAPSDNTAQWPKQEEGEKPPWLRRRERGRTPAGRAPMGDGRTTDDDDEGWIARSLARSLVRAAASMDSWRYCPHGRCRLTTPRRALPRPRRPAPLYTPMPSTAQ